MWAQLRRAKTMTNAEDRNFDDLTEKFARKVYAGLKGQIRLGVISRDLSAALPAIDDGSNALHVLDVGGGLGQQAVRLAQRGHHVVYNDLSDNMMREAKRLAQKHQVGESVRWYCGPYQELDRQLHTKFDLIMCHALIEWLEKPQCLLQFLSRWLNPGGFISLTFYNRDALEYRNLIRGNFRVLVHPFVANSGSLTPGHPLTAGQVLQWLNEACLDVRACSGIRVFHDYVTTPRGGHNNPLAVLQMELKYSQLEPYKWMGRYMHMLAQSPL